MGTHHISNLDLNQRQLLNAVFQNLTTAPENPKTGQFYFNTVQNCLMIYDGSEWIATSGGGEGKYIPLAQKGAKDGVCPLDNNGVVDNSYLNLATVATSGDYDDLLNKPNIPTVPTDVSAFNNDVGYLTEHQDISGKADKSSLSAVATSGDYDDLLNKPTIPSPQIQSDWSQSDSTKIDYIKNKPTIPVAQVNADWNAVSGVAEILNKPTLSNVATSGSYTDLSNTPTIPSKLSDLTDDSSTHPIIEASTLTGLTASITELNYCDGVTSDIQTQLNGKQTTLTAGSNISIVDNVISATTEAVATTPRFSVNKGNVNAQGTMDILSYSGQTLSFKVDDGTTYAPMTCTTGYSGEQFTKESLDSISTSSLSEATYNVFAPKTDTTAYMLNNVIFVQPDKPSDSDTDVIPTMTSATTPYGTVTTPDGGYWDDYNLFASGEVTCTGTISNSKAIIYTFDESHQPQAGVYKIKYTAPSQYAGYVQKFIITLIDNSQITVSASNKATNFTLTFTCTDTIKSIAFYPHNASYGTRYGRVQLSKSAITDEGTLWVNTGIEPLEVMARDENAQWQPFNDVLLGTCTVDSSHNITAISNQGFNYFSTVNMHNMSAIAHADIRTELNSKVNSSALATVATSGSYNDLTNKPTIPDAQVQANWNETNTSSKAYIQNKPTIPTVPTALSSFTDDLGSSPTHTHSQYLTSHQDISGKEDVNKAMNTLATSDTIALSDNSVNKVTPTGNITFTLPTVTDLTVFHQILVQINLSTVYTIDVSTSYFFNQTAPDLSNVGVYNLIFEYDNANSYWVCGLLTKGQE